MMRKIQEQRTAKEANVMENSRDDVRIFNPLREVEPSKLPLAPNRVAMEKFLKKREERAAPGQDGLYQGGLYDLEINTIRTDDEQPRKYFNPQSLRELSESIRRKGVLQPILVTKTPTGRIQLVAGERRLRAAKMAVLQIFPPFSLQAIPWRSP